MTIDNDLQKRLKELLKKEESILKRFVSFISRQETLLKKAVNKNKYDNICWMDGSLYFWLCVIEMAKRDFIAYYVHPDKWDINSPIGKIWVTSYVFLFKNNYKISINIEECPDCKDEQEQNKCKTCLGQKIVKSNEGKKLSLKDILDICNEASGPRKINISILNPSVKKLREHLANEIQDEWLNRKILEEEENAREVNQV